MGLEDLVPDEDDEEEEDEEEESETNWDEMNEQYTDK